MKNELKVGSLVKLRDDVLQRHSLAVPAHMGYSTAQFQWRDTLRKLEGKTGIVQRVFEGSNHVNVDFGGVIIGIDFTELVADE